MKKLKDKLRTKSFWLSIAAGVVLILQTLGIKVDAPYVNEIIETVCALLVLVGVFTAPLNKTDGNKTQEIDAIDSSAQAEETAPEDKQGTL